MRILIVNKYAHVTGGADRHALLLSRHLRAAGHEVAWLSTESSRNEESEGEFVQLTVTHASRDHLRARERLTVARQAIWSDDAARAMMTSLRRFRPDVVHVHKLYPQLSVAPVVVAAQASVPIVQTLHDYELISASPFDPKGSRIDRHSPKRSYRALNTWLHLERQRRHVPAVTSWISVSKYVACAHAAKGITADVIPNFTEVGHGETPAPFGGRNGVLFVGQLLPEKGLADVLQVAEQLRDLDFTVVGDGPLAPAVRDGARRLPNLRYVGHLRPAEVADLISAVRVTMIPSRVQEAGPLVALESMALGTPVAAYPRGGLSEYVAAGGGIVTDATVESLARACRLLHEDEAVWSAHSQAASRRATEVHSPNRYIERLELVYQRAIQDHRLHSRGDA